MFYDSLNEEKVVESLPPVAVTGTVSGSQVIDTTGAKYCTHELILGVPTTLDSGDNLALSINESDACATNGQSLTNPTALPAANILGVEYITGGTFSGGTANNGVNKVAAGQTLPTLNNSTTFASGTVIRIYTEKNKTFQRITLTGTGSPSVILGAVAKLSGFTYTPTT